MRKQLIMGLLLCLMPFFIAHGEFVFEAGFKGPVKCAEVTEANMGESQECGADPDAPASWPATAYNNSSPFDGLTMTMQTTQANGTVPFMQRDPLIIGPGGEQEPNQEIPFEVQWKSCYNDFFNSGTPPPVFVELPANQGVSVVYQYGGSVACSQGSGGENGALKLIRKPLAELPEEGDYISSITFVVSAE